ncbi:hypothetical protein Pmani_008070 [Petrolisthes manimaculis]|uniref:BICC1 first type I KH domain-containing protein n=1 Tax=Petrolisthes manimaculis TaxID=1843537 RepID=A0AAE1UJE4_9EUCA|nr:hypothetical protein Pmani_008070 [Petrolisthes manimaculis]
MPTFTVLGDGVVEEKFRVDRRKLETMIFGCPADPNDLETMKGLPVDDESGLVSADDFFQEIMEATNTEIKYPKFLKVGARNKRGK